MATYGTITPDPIEFGDNSSTAPTAPRRTISNVPCRAQVSRLLSSTSLLPTHRYPDDHIVKSPIVDDNMDYTELVSPRGQASLSMKRTSSDPHMSNVSSRRHSKASSHRETDDVPGLLKQLHIANSSDSLFNAFLASNCGEFDSRTTSSPTQENGVTSGSGYDMRFFGATVNMLNTITGTGMLALPYAFAQLGLGLATSLLIVFAALTWYSLRLLVASATYVHTSSADATYVSLARATMPNWRVAPALVDLAMILTCLSMAVSYVVVIGDTVTTLLGAPSSSAPGWEVAFLILLIPISLYDSLEVLTVTSALALVFVAYLALVVIGFAFTGVDTIEIPEKVGWFRLTPQFLGILPLFAFAFTCHQNMFAICVESGPQVLAKIDQVINVSVVGTAMVYEIVGASGYLTVGDAAQSNLLLVYPEGWLVNGARVAFIALAVCSLPFQVQPARASLDSMI
ncbi:hypothetical protein SeMB42_g00198, partial [Synchytrium endobioticum]